MHSKKTKIFCLWLSSIAYVLTLPNTLYCSFFSRYGGKRVLFTVIILSSALTLLMPVCARTSVYLVYAIRVLLGLLTVSHIFKNHKNLLQIKLVQCIILIDNIFHNFSMKTPLLYLQCVSWQQIFWSSFVRFV